MPISAQDIERTKLRILAKPFIKEVKESIGWALVVPDAIIDNIPIGKEKAFTQILKDAGLKQQKDFKWYY